MIHHNDTHEQTKPFRRTGIMVAVGIVAWALGMRLIHDKMVEGKHHHVVRVHSSGE